MAQPDYSGSSMLALYPPADLAEKLAVEGGLDPDELHLTVVYTGDAADVDRKKLRKAAKRLADRPPVVGKITGHARLTGGDQDVIVALVDSRHVEKLHNDALDELAGKGIDAPSEHSYLQHITLAYVGKDDPDPVVRLPSKPVTFTAITAAHGKNRKHRPFDTTLAEAAREAFAAGWALSGGPYTDRVEAGLAAAVETALEHCDDPGVLETTLQIGKLTGLWARFFDRRKKLTDAKIAAALKAWQVIAADLGVADVIDRLRAELGTTAAALTADYLQSVTGSAASGLLAGAYAHDGHGDFLTAVEDAIQAAMAEGKAGALALNADKHNVDFSFDAAYKAVFDQIANLPDLAVMGQRWVQRILAGSAGDVGRLLARLFTDGATKAEMVTAVEQALTAAGNTAAGEAISLFVDQAMATAMSQASLDLYASEGTGQAWYVSAGDGRVCSGCSDYEQNSPYPVLQCPVPGWHPRCRCVVTPDDPAPFKALAALLA